MKPRERREQELQAKCASGDPRALLLAATPAVDRSAVAARYDHQLEAVALDQCDAPTSEELEQIKMRLWRASVAVELIDAGYRDLPSRYIHGNLVSAGMQREIERAEAVTPYPSDTEALAEWEQSRRLRREYIRQRYGV